MKLALGIFCASGYVVLAGTSSASHLWHDQTDEFLGRCVKAAGVPAELEGSLYFAGPSLWSLGEQKLSHSFDGLGRLHRLYYDAASEELCHSARFITSPGNKAILESCDLTRAGAFARIEGTTPWWAKLPLAGLLAANLDNTWVNNMLFGGKSRLELMTDTSEVVVADAVTLEVEGKIEWNDTAVKTLLPVPPLSTAHPIVHPSSGEAYNVLLDAGMLSHDVVVFKRNPAAPSQRHVVARVPVGFNMLVQHSWGLSKDYAIILGHPMFLDPLKALATGDMVKALAEQPEKQNHTRIFVAPLSGDGPVKEYLVEPVMNVHTINAYEHEGRLTIDFEGRPVKSSSESFYSAFAMDVIHQPEKKGREFYREHFVSRGYGLYRLDLPLSESSPSQLLPVKKLSEETLVFPQLSTRVRGQKHCFIWAASGANIFEEATAIVKLNVCDSSQPHQQWRLDGYSMVAEASYVPAMDTTLPEDAGYLLAPVHNTTDSTGALAVVDAAKMELVTLVRLPAGDAFNWCAHSTFVRGLAEKASQAEVPRREDDLSYVKTALKACAARSMSEAKPVAADL
eukprot:TRINITY_DN42288_c0_g1_i1.p1 TRINITY_DN42288_c0_g1~~TRINITY_DN42288_c0_g1_i1.p1  ORF type:complete len:567 (+),score=106.71 TRINITY_DN42288_c0_g1_i1:119-1819(+)